MPAEVLPLVGRARQVITIARAALPAAITTPGLHPCSAELTRVAAIAAPGRATVAHHSFRSLATDDLPAPPLTCAPAAIAPIVLGAAATVIPVGVCAPSGTFPASVGVPGLTHPGPAAASVGVVIAGAVALARMGQIVAGSTGSTGSTAHVVTLVVVRAQVAPSGRDDENDEYDHSGQNDQRGHDTIQHGVALGDARQPRAAIDASLP